MIPPPVDLQVAPGYCSRQRHAGEAMQNQRKGAFACFFLTTLLLLTVAWFAAPARAQDAASDRDSPLTVLTKPIAPFVIPREKGKPEGFSIDLWEALARHLNRPFRWKMRPDLKTLLDDIAAGRGDIAIAAITITAERERRMDFSHPFFRSGLQIMIRDEPAGLLRQARDVLARLASSASLRLALFFLLVIVIVAAHLIWLAERRHNRDFHENYLRGLWDGIYWTLVTISTVGYGDKCPRTQPGRSITLVLIIVGYMAYAWFTASIAAALTVNELQASITGPGDLSGRKVATVASSTSERFLRRLPGAEIIPVRGIEQAYALLERGEVDAVVYDFPALRQHALGAGRGKVRIVGPVFQHEPYGIALPPGSPLREAINRALLDMMESGEYDRIYVKWFGQPSS